MTMFLEELKAQFSDVLRPNLYHVYIKPSWASENVVNFGYLSQAATFPFVTFNTQQAIYNNVTQYFVNGYDYDPVSFDFLLDADLKVLKFFNEWVTRIRNSINTEGLTFEETVEAFGTYNYRDEYEADIEVVILNPRQFEVAKCNMIACFPVNLENLALAYANNDQLLTLSVSFRYTEITYSYDPNLSVSGVVADVFEQAEKLTNPIADKLAEGLKKNLPDNELDKNTIKDAISGQGGGTYQQSSSRLIEKAKLANKF